MNELERELKAMAMRGTSAALDGRIAAMARAAEGPRGGRRGAAAMLGGAVAVAALSFFAGFGAGRQSAVADLDARALEASPYPQRQVEVVLAREAVGNPFVFAPAEDIFGGPMVATFKTLERDDPPAPGQ